jgi:lipoprotein-releasing system permease protein
MSLSWELVLRFSFGRGQRRFTRFVALASLLGMMLGVAALITVLSVMNGFSGELHKRLLSVTPDMIVVPADTGPAALEQWVGRAKMLPDVLAATSFANGTALLRSGNRSRGVEVAGISASGLRDVIDLPLHMIEGDVEMLEAVPFSVVLGADLARLLRVQVGDDVDMLLPRLTVSPMGVFPRIRPVRVAGIFAVGAPPDARVVYTSESTARKLFGSAGERGVQLRLADRNLASLVREDLSAMTPDSPRIEDWRSSQGSLFSAIKMEKITVGVLLTSVILVAAFNLVSTLTMSVTEKRSDIAILQVLGLTTRHLLTIFLGHGLVLAIIGIAAGALMGVGLAVSVSDLSLWVERVSGAVLFDPAVYYIGGLPSVVMWSDVAAVVLVALLLSVAASVYPAWRASRIPPAEALNYV